MRPRVDPWRRVPLDVDQVATEIRARRAPEMVETDLHERVDRRIAGDVATEVAFATVGPHDHRHRVPAHIRADSLLKHRITRGVFLEVRRDCVDVGGVRRVRDVRAGTARLVDQRFEQKVRSLGTLAFEDGFKSIEPFLSLERVGIVGCLGNCGHRCCLPAWRLKHGPGDASAA